MRCEQGSWGEDVDRPGGRAWGWSGPGAPGGGPGWPGVPGGGGGFGRMGGFGGPGGPPPWLAGLFGMGGEATRGRPKVRRGDVRSAILDVLRAAGEAGEPINGYQVIQQIAERSDGEWRPSPGSVYPTIQQLEDEGLVEGDDERGRRSIRLTAEGRAHVAEHAAEIAAVWAPFERRGRGADRGWTSTSGGGDLKSEIGQVMSAVWSITTSGTEGQRRAAIGVLVDTRRRLYGILADGADGAEGADGDDGSEDGDTGAGRR